MSNLDGAPGFDVDVEHLPDRRRQLWLHEGASRTSLGFLDESRGCYPVIQDRVAARLGLTTSFFYVQLHIPRPSYVQIGARVLAREDDGRLTDGVVIDWVNGEVFVRPVDPWTGEQFGGGLYAPEDVTFPQED